MFSKKLLNRHKTEIDRSVFHKALAQNAGSLLDKLDIRLTCRAFLSKYYRIPMASTPLLSIVLFLLAAIVGAAGQFLYKSGADLATSGLLSFLFNTRIVLGIVCYIAVMVLFVAAFKRGGSLTVLYPVYASTFIWAAIIARIAYGTPILPIHMLGWLLLIGGMFLMGWSAPSNADGTTESSRVKPIQALGDGRHGS